jgi:hypothetical protein
MSRHSILIAFVFTLFLSGCGGAGSPKAVDVSGVISLDDKPLEGVEVYFATDKFEGYGKTDEDGKYRLVNGAAAGPNKVYLKKFNTDVATGIDTSIPGMDEGQVAAMLAAQSQGPQAKNTASLIPTEYSDPKTTKLSFPVPDGGTSSADFRISSK